MELNEVWKFPIYGGDSFTAELPEMAKVMHVAMQQGKPFMWVLVNPEYKPVKRTFYVRGTGHPIAADMVHLGTFLMHDDSLVLHLFEHKDAWRKPRERW